jgi:hypothetical protein
MAEINYFAVEGPSSSGYGSDLFDFGYIPSGLPPAQAATTASQIEAGGGGFNWNAALKDITGAWLTVEAFNAKKAELPTSYRTNELGQTYAVDPDYRGPQTLGGVGSAIGGIPTAWLLIGALIVGAIMMAKEDD